MITTETDYQTLFEIIPPEAVVTLYNISWEEYEALLNEFDEQPRVRLTYDNGRLDIMTVSAEHEGIVSFIPLIIFVLAQELNLNYLSRRSTTLRKKKKSKGTDPDDCYYFKNYQQISGKKRLDLAVDPPPDLAIEVDITNRSTNKFPIYAALEVAELWRHNGKEIIFYELVDETYFEARHSRLFPLLTPDVLLNFLQIGEAEGVVVMANQFREWVHANKA